MEARRPRPRRWWVRRRRFLDAEGYQVTDTWLNIPLLPRRILTWRSPVVRVGNRGFGVTRVTISGHGGVPTRRRVIVQRILTGVFAALNAINILRYILINHWVARIPDCLVILVGIGILAVMSCQVTHRPE